MSRIAGQQLFRVVHDHLHGLTALQREKITGRDIHKSALAAEVTADMHRTKDQLLFGDPEAVGQLRPHGERRLAARPDFRAAGGIRLHHARMRFQIRLVSHLGRKSIFDDQIGLLETGFDIALAPFEIGEHIAELFHGNRKPFVREQIGMEYRRVGSDRLERI